MPGVGEVVIFGTAYSMRVWFDPDKLTKYGMTSDDVVAAVRAYNVQVSAGQFGGAPAVPGQRLNASILVQSLLVTPEEFAAIPLRTNPDGSIVRVRDIGRTELGTEVPDIKLILQRPCPLWPGHPPGGGRQRPGDRRPIKAKMEELSAYFPPGMKVDLPLRHHALRAGGHQGGLQDPVRGDRPGVPRHVPLHGQPARHPRAHHRGAGGDPGHLRRPGGSLATPSTC